MTARMRLQPEAVGMGMTGQRVRDRLIDRLRDGAPGIAAIRDERVLNAIRTVPRHLFVDEALAARAYEDNALPIGHGQTISQPWVVARMTEAVLEGLPQHLSGEPARPSSCLLRTCNPSVRKRLRAVRSSSPMRSTVNTSRPSAARMAAW